MVQVTLCSKGVSQHPSVHPSIQITDQAASAVHPSISTRYLQLV